MDGAEVTGNIPTQTVDNTTVSQLAGYYNAFDLSAVDTDLASGNVRSTVSIYGVAGNSNVVNTSSGDAAAGDIKDGKKAWVDGNEVTGELHGGCTCCSTCTLYASRWCDNGDGTVTDLTTCLVWLKKADWGGTRKLEDCTTHYDAHTQAGTLRAGFIGADLSDGSVEGDWRLPTKTELDGLVNGTPNLRCTSGPCDLYAFTGVQSYAYWSSTTDADYPLVPYAWYVYLPNGFVSSASKTSTFYVWPVRGGQ